MSRTVAIIQARTGSSRLPGKVLLPLAGTTVLGFMVTRVKMAKKIDEIIIATTDNADDTLSDEAKKLGVSVFRGSENDVLKRFTDAAHNSGAEVIIRLTADCPLMDGDLSMTSIEPFFNSQPYDYFSNVMQRSFPDGLDVEIFTLRSLIHTERECKDPWAREHVTPYMRSGDKTY